MGVPKFYRWISERYPCLSEVVKEYQIPEFDNLYLDMNGIIHVCSHPNDDDPHFRISEEEIYKDIFHYIEVLFRMIQPKKIFYMAIDGVAPRAKMNQQRGRRFRSAREAEENERRAREKGEVLPTEARFDSNCITPGTEFMAKLDAQLQYFISSKITSDRLWQNCSVIYSSHKTPGEGEHKIMEYIRYSKSQQGYDPNTRHCLYGLDADLIMLGLTTHEPHFSLLREEVRFGGKKGSKSKRISAPEETTFHLLHLSLMREYIEYEFFELHDTLHFPFNLESIIDDWVLMGFLVGNDFIPHLPGLHINKDALPLLYDTYKQVLPTLDGYLNEGGHLNLARLEIFMAKLTEFDVGTFREVNDNLKYMAGKRAARLEKFEFDDDDGDDDCRNKSLTNKEMEETFARLGIGQHMEDFSEDEERSNSSSDDEDERFEEEFRQHKRDYYMSKMLYKDVTPEVLRDQATNYVRGLQWILHYYYDGICSWSWYYPHHYAPYISDVRDFAGIDLSFDKGTPFFPFEQLLAVLPPLSANLLPKAYQNLMLADDSPLKEFYPNEFQTDLNGKQQDWEAVVLIPFINEKLLLEAMKPCTAALSIEEKERNTHGPMFIYKYTSDNMGEYKAPDYFLSITQNRASVEYVWREDWDLPPSRIIKGILPGFKTDVYYSGFPTLRHVPHTFRKEFATVRVFQQDSRGESFILEVSPKTFSMYYLLKYILGKVVLVSWPHLVEAQVVAIDSEKSRFYLRDKIPCHKDLDAKQVKFWEAKREDLKTRYMKRFGIDLGDINFIVYAKQMSGRTYVVGQDGQVTLEKTWSEMDQPYPLQTIVRDITLFEPGFKEYSTMQEYFTPGSKVFMLGNPSYGCMGEVIEILPEHKGRIRVSMVVPVEPQLHLTSRKWEKCRERYCTASECASRLSISPQLFARLTGSVFMAKALELNPFMDRETATNKLNIGLNLKSNKRSEEVVGFTRRLQESKQWLYSDECVNCLREYQSKFPEIFEFMNRNPSKNDMFQDEIFPTNYKERVPELTKWLKDAPFTVAERQKWSSIHVDQYVIQEIINEVESVASQRAKSVNMQIKPHLLFKPSRIQGNNPPDPKVTFELFDRVINIREGFSVPLGARGTIIGIQNEVDTNQKVQDKEQKESEKYFTILFDQPFAGGLSLAGPASANRCYRLNWAAMINLTHGQKMIKHQEFNLASKYKVAKTSEDDDKTKVPVNKCVIANQSSPPLDCGFQQNLSSSDNFISPQIAPVPRTPPGSSSKCFNNKEEKDEDVPQPPNPNQLPKPLHLTVQPIKNQSVGDTATSVPSKASSPKGHNNSPVRPIKSENDVQVVIHGNFYEHWPSIREKGLRRDHRHYIPCVSYVPHRFGASAAARSYEIHIYLKVGKLLKDGMNLLRLQKGQVLCSTDSNGFVSPEYFEKVVDTASGLIIFPVQDDPTGDKKFFSPPYPVRGLARHNNDSRKGLGRGFHSPPNPLQVHDNIWRQMLNAVPHSPSITERFPQPETTGGVFNLSSFDESAKSTQRFVPSNLSSHIYSTSHQALQPSTYSSNNLFNYSTFQPYAYHAQPYLNYFFQDQTRLNNQRKQASISENTYTHSTQQHNSSTFDSHNHHSNSSSNTKSRFVNPYHNSKSPFIPTQVAGKQTQRKLYSEVHSPKKNPSELPPSETSSRGAGSSHSGSGHSFTAKKPKKKHRNRLAANLGLIEPVHHDNG